MNVELVADAAILGDIADGKHPTTQYYLDLIEQLVKPDDHVLDVGTGTGILAIAAAIMGATHVDAFDIVPEVGKILLENYKANEERFLNRDKVIILWHLVRRSILERPRRLFNDPYQLIVRNIDSPIVSELGRLDELLAPSGHVVFTRKASDEIGFREAPEHWLALSEEVVGERWRVLHFQKPMEVSQ